jgi:hypothetical protein
MTTDATEINTLHPSLMKPVERRSEIAAILAAGVLRLKQGQAAQKHSRKASNSLDLAVFPSVYGMDENHKNQGETDG